MADLNATLKARGGTHGDFGDNAKIAQAIKEIMRESPNWYAFPDWLKEGLDLIALKQARILSGDFTHEDNYHDGAGYFKLMEDRIREYKGSGTS